MIKNTILFGTLFLTIACQQTMPTYTSFADYPVYAGTDLGLTYHSERSTFKLWAPTAQKVRLNFYEQGIAGNPTRTTVLQRTEQGVWAATFEEDLEGLYYAFQVQIDNAWLNEVPDPYAKAVGVNGLRGQVVNFEQTNPENWQKDKRPDFENFTDLILYELHFRDLSIHPNSGIQQKGKYLGLTETGTSNSDGLSTGLDHIKELGVTHIHILPSYDHYSIDETQLDKPQFNWGYDPQNYNVPEGSYASDPYDGSVRIKEFKQMVKTLHENGLSVILDVVYNHTGKTEEANFNQLVPGYYYRQNEDGSFSDASACGNETASERPMVRKFIIESVKHWVEEYHIDGFRFDLMGIHDVETMNQIASELHQIDPNLFIYGEGWTAGDSPLPEQERALKKHALRMPNVAVFSDDMRDGVKGHVFTPTDKGFASGKFDLKESVKFGIVGATEHPQVDYANINYSDAPYANHPTQNINYISCHDNHTLWDRLTNSNPDDSEADRIKMHQLANAIVLTSQGVPFLHAGVEFLRAKGGVENSFESPDAVNQIDWSRKTTYQSVFEYYKGLIALRKHYKAFRNPSSDFTRAHLRFLDISTAGVIAYTLNDLAEADGTTALLVAFNANPTAQVIDLPDPNKKWTVILDESTMNLEGIEIVSGSELTLPPFAALVSKR